MGVGNFQFSRDESERENQMNFFKDMQLEVNHIKYLKQLLERYCQCP